jgi:hypothetical protein
MSKRPPKTEDKKHLFVYKSKDPIANWFHTASKYVQEDTASTNFPNEALFLIDITDEFMYSEKGMFFLDWRVKFECETLSNKKAKTNSGLPAESGHVSNGDVIQDVSMEAIDEGMTAHLLYF